MTEWLNVGKIVNTHGINGEVRVISRTDFPETRYATGSELMIFESKTRQTPVKVKSWRQHKQFDLLTFENFGNVNDVEKFKGSLLKVDKAKVNDHLSEDEFYYRDIIGLHVYTEDGDYLGKVKEILSPGANDVWVVQSADTGKDLLIPYIDSVVKHVNVKEEKIIITPMEGLFD
ncbi:ribosome maturation factor RimM [Salipaludibacillus keqinensis]|uniref:Ribosome maturation factor RimM n=1 Tax=Salipaludibacillus keqinensis TaxID=2045207 RepID=A0A323TDP0_9BACI|nr:ribosome maturation factor RimM [Salipaludibacillus keqinensis]PYZ93169.1 ribosome maturation factor RimM [Salipaludibacillus keqinensis]